MKKNISPFIKWVGGKTQLISEINEMLPKEIDTYIEPFIGGGAILFSLLENREIPNIVINDSNIDLVNTYKTVRDNVNELINILSIFEYNYHSIDGDNNLKNKYYYRMRENFNSHSEDIITQSAIFIFLNKTCFNGLFRVNKKNEFNVPIGGYRLPKICDSNNLLNISQKLKNVTILCGDYSETLKYTKGKTLFYFDPPYKPLSKTSGFISYQSNTFNDDEQIRLNTFCLELNRLNYKWILSNSKPDNDFFNDLYKDFNIHEVLARRVINSKGDKRGEISELLINNIDEEINS
jgi:DNA adenine methylase